MSATPESLTSLAAEETTLRHDWTQADIEALFALPFNDLLFRAHSVHRANFEPNTVQVSTLLSIKTGSCPEDCAYCPQSAHYNTGLEKERLLDTQTVLAAAERARQSGATRFCMGAAWRKLNDRDVPAMSEIISGVKAMGLETCMTLGMLTEDQAKSLRGAGLDYYNHNLDTSREYYDEIITTRTYEDRLETLRHVRATGMSVCSGGIIGMGEGRSDRAGLLMELANQPEHPDSVPINLLVQVEGTPLKGIDELDPFEFVRMIAVARIIMPQSQVRLSAGRENMTDELQAMCFFAGANSIFYGEKLLTTDNPDADHDKELFRRLGITAGNPEACSH
jgi:biotin synthase